MLIVVEDWYVEFFFQSLFNLEATWRRDVFKVDPTETGCDSFHCPHDLIGVFRIQTDRKRIDAGEFLEQHRLPFHHRQRGCWSNVAETKDGCAVSYYCDCVFLDGKGESFVWFLINCVADTSDAGRVGH